MSQRLNHSPLRALTLSVEVRVSETVDAEAEHVVGLQGFTKEVAIATTILPETERDSIHTSIGKKLDGARHEVHTLEFSSQSHHCTSSYS